MPTPSKLTREDRERYEANLAFWYDEDFYPGIGFYQLPLRAIDQIIGTMRLLELSSYRGYTITELEQLRDYVGRTAFRRKLSVQMMGDTPNDERPTGIGIGTLIAQVSEVDITLRLRSEDGKTKLVTVLRCYHPSDPPSNIVSRDIIRVDLEPHTGRRLWSYGSHMTFHYVSEQERKYRCTDNCFPGCNEQGARISNERLEATFEDGGVEAMWQLMDNVWADRITQRLTNKPLTLTELKIRCGVHADQTVKVFTPFGAVFGKPELADDGGAVVIHEPTGASRAIPAQKIREIVPYRL